MPLAAKDKSRWGEEDEEEEQSPIPPQDNGIKERVKFVTNSKGQKVKITTKVRVREARIKVPHSVENRKGLPKFGLAKNSDEKVTTPSRDFILMEHPNDQLNESDEFTRNVQAFRAEYKLSEFTEDITETEPAYEEEATETAKPGVYVPPSKKGSGTKMGDAEGTENTLRVSNLTKAVTEEDLRDLFERFGRIHRISLPKVEEKGVKVPRGFAYIAFARRDDAENAMNRLQGYGYDHLIIKIEWAKPGAGLGGGGGMNSSYVSGYGQKLAQETTEKVYFSSTKDKER